MSDKTLDGQQPTETASSLISKSFSIGGWGGGRTRDTWSYWPNVSQFHADFGKNLAK